MKPSNISLFLVGGLVFAHGTAAIGQTIALVPKSSTGAYFLAGDEITTTAGSIVTLEVLAYGWGNAPGNLSMSVAVATFDYTSFAGLNANPSAPGLDLVPLGYALPDPNGGNRAMGVFTITNVCSVSGRNCTTGQGDECTGAEGFCIGNPRWLFSNCSGLVVPITGTLAEYAIAGKCQTSGLQDVNDPIKKYLGSLRLVIPPEAIGTYTVAFFDDDNNTFLLRPNGFEIPGLTTLAARITLAETIPPQPAFAPHDVVKNRYVSFVPSGGESLQAYQVRLASSMHNPGAVGFTGWVGVPSIGLYPSSAVQAAPVFRVWNESILHVGDCEIQPGATYEIRATTDGVTFSEPLTVTTSAQPSGGKDWGDITGVNNGTAWTPPNGIANVNDILAIRSFITQIDPIPPFYRVNLQAISTADSCVNPFVNTADTFMAILAVSGQPYPFVDDPAMCPVCP